MSAAAMLSPREAYRLWAPSYADETAISFLDTELAAAMAPAPAGRFLLDAGCGIGRRLPGDAALAIGVDASPEMLAVAAGGRLAAADLRALPFADGAFDLAWCRLVLGHIADPAPCYRELARVCRPGAELFVTDIHADCIAAGHRRNFRDGAGTVREIEHHVHDARAHITAAADAGWMLAARRDGVVGPSIESFYRQAGRMAAYDRDHGLALVAGFLFRRTDACAC